MKKQRKTLSTTEMNEILTQISSLKKSAKQASTLEAKEEVLSKLNLLDEKLQKEYEIASSADVLDMESRYTKQIDMLCDKVDEAIDAVQKNIEKMNRPGFGKITAVGGIFHRQAKAKKEDLEVIDLDKPDRKMILKRTGIVAGTALAVGLLSFGGYKVYSRASAAKQAKIAAEEAEAERLRKLEEEALQAQAAKEAAVAENAMEEEVTKEERILEIVKQITEEFNKHESFNVTEEQVLALFIHLNVSNSYTTGNTIALDKVTREELIKTYFVGLEKGTKTFEEYQITDDDLSKMTTEVLMLRNAAANRAIVLNDEGKFAESREIIALVSGLITDETLKDEANTLITSVQGMQTNDDAALKQEVYRYYNYIFAGPKSNVRNFADYGSYLDGDGDIMTYENQGPTIRFLTWYLDAFVGIRISGKNLIPQDIINAKEAKLMDHSMLMRSLGYKNCGANMFDIYYSNDFEKPIDNRTKKSKYGSTSKSSSSKVAAGTGNAGIDQEIDEKLKQNSAVGSSFTLSDGTTATVVESGPSSTTIVIGGGGNQQTVDQPPVNDGKTTIIEGGGNEQTEEIHFGEDQTEIIIEEGGDVISYTQSTNSMSAEQMAQEEAARKEAERRAQEEADRKAREEAERLRQSQTVEVITFEEDDTTVIEEGTTASIANEMNALLRFKQLILGQEIVPGKVVFVDENAMQKVKC